MPFHLGEPKRHFPEEAPVAWDPIRRALEENEDWYRDLVEHSQDLLCVHDLRGRLLSVNPVPARLLGYTVEEVMRKPMREFVDPQFRDQFDVYLREIARTGESRGLLAVVTRSGEQRIWEYHNTLRTEGMTTPIVRGMAHDVTERVRAEKALRATNEQMLKTVREQERTLHELTLFRTLLDQSNDSIKVIDPETLRFLDVNERAYAELGYSREELLSMTVYDIDPNTDESVLARVRQQLRESGFAIMETVHRRKDGTMFPVEVNMRQVRLDREYVVSVSRDITERKRTEEALRESEARERTRANELETVLDAVPVAVCIAHDIECRRITGNRAAHEQMRVPAGKNFAKSAAPEEQPGLRLMQDGVEIPADLMPMQQAAAKGKPVYGRPLTIVFEDGSERETLSTAIPLLDEEGKPRGAVGASIDLTELKQAEKALRESELRFRAVYERSPVGIALVDSRTGRFLQVNPKFCEIAGRSEDELLRIDLASITHPDDIGQTSECLQQLAEEKLANYEMEKRYLRPDGSVRWVRILAVPMWGKGEQQRWHMGLVEDITERKQAEEALKKSEEKFSKAFRQSPLALTITSAKDHRYIEVNETFERVSGWRRDEVIGRTPFDIGLWVDPAERTEIAKRILTDGSLRNVEVSFRMRDGSIRIALLTAEAIELNGEPCMITVGADITERKRTEEALRQSEERFRVALKNSPIAVFNQDRDLRYTWMYNPQLPGTASEHLGKTAGEIFNAEDAARITEIRRRVLETGVGVRHEMQVTLDGKKHYLDTTIEPVLDAAGAVIGLTGAGTDVTELRETAEALSEAKKKLAEEKLYLEQEIDTELGFGEIIGQSKALQSVMEQVGKVAASDATVLLLGETGTGKELVARAIHRLSLRADNSFIKLNCAAIPSGLLESELFGNEKGAFTGAVNKKIGRVELADKGTLFLDEIGEISLALQPKLLRVLQDQEFERLGGTQTLKVDFRLIAATNRNLAESVRENEFRSDLYYRLNVFPIRVPPLRERREDIRLLVEHCVQKCARRMNKSITSIPKKTMDTLMGWEWPGNVRELENFIERSVILTQGSVLLSPLSELQLPPAKGKDVDETLEAAEREHILRALRESHGQIGGLKGAAMRLGLKRTTLQSKLKHLGINPRSAHP